MSVHLDDWSLDYQKYDWNSLSVCLSVCSLVPTIGKTESVAASSCKEVRDILSNECSGKPQSGTYWITVTDPHTGDNRTMRVGQKHTLA